MMKTNFLSLLLNTSWLASIFACASRNDIVRSECDSRDSLISQDIALSESYSYSDTTNPNYRFLKAYSRKDTAYLSRFLEAFKQSMFAVPELLIDSCMAAKALISSGTKEAYRFIFQEAWGSYTASITVFHSDSMSNMHVLFYKPKVSDKPCQLLTEYDKALSSAQWDSIRNALNYAEFWGLRGDNGRPGIDGTTLLIDGYKQGNDLEADRQYHVYRWQP